MSKYFDDDDYDDFDDIDDNSMEEDNDDPYGEDGGDPYGDDEGEVESQEENVESGEENKDNKEEEGKAKDSNSKGLNVKKMRAMAKALDLPGDGPIPLLRCPDCKKQSLFREKIMPMGVRIAAYVTLGAFGLVPIHSAPKAVRFCCMNPKCKSYYYRTRKKVYAEEIGNPKLQKELGIINVPRS